MGMIQCNQRHFYDAGRHSSCPICGVDGLDVGPTKPKVVPRVEKEEVGDTIPKDRQMGVAIVDGPTVPVHRNGEQAGFSPVVGWLVCAVGPDRGRDYRIREGQNFIGRMPKNQICLANDQTISSDRHARLIYDPTDREFLIAAGESTGLIYLNGKRVLAPTALKPHDRLKLGSTELIFVPFCGENFTWEQESDIA